MTAEKYFRQLRLPELARRSYPKRHPRGISDELADPGNRRFKAFKPESANHQFFVNQLEREITPYVWAHPDEDDRR